MWVEFVVGYRYCSEGFSKFQFNLESEGHRFVSRKNCQVSPLLNKVDLSIQGKRSILIALSSLSALNIGIQKDHVH